MSVTEWRDDQVQLLWTSRVDYDAGGKINLHRHIDYWQLLFVNRGRGVFQIGEHSFRANEDSCFLIPRNTEHEFLFQEISITIDFKFVVQPEPLEEMLIRLCGRGGMVEIHEEIRDQLIQVHRGACMGLDRLLVDVRFKEALLTMLMPNDGLPGMVAGVGLPRNEMELFFHQRLNEPLDLNDAASAFGFHPHYFIELFRNQSGYTPIQYFQKIRLEKALNLLEQTSQSVESIAMEAGWTLSYFSKLFKRTYGLSPTQYRDRSKMGINKGVVLRDDFVQ